MNNLINNLEVSKVFDFQNLVTTKVESTEKNISQSIKNLVKKVYSQNIDVNCLSFEALTKQESQLVLESSEKMYSLFQTDDYEVISVLTKDTIAQFLQLLLGVDNKKSIQDLRHPSDLELFFVDDFFAEISNLSMCDIGDYMFRVDLKNEVSLMCSFHMFRLSKVQGSLS